jgi:DNA-binding CsgD family transcriptional regulator/tetratricopeptide (TPR) repeat protein
MNATTTETGPDADTTAAGPVSGADTIAAPPVSDGAHETGTKTPAAVETAAVANPTAAVIDATWGVAGAMIGDVLSHPDTVRPILGRDRELADLSELVGVGGDPRPRSVLVAGDAGVGKTRLLTELLDRAGTAGFRTLVGHCLDFGDSALPYLPFSEMFGRLAADEPAVAARLAQAHPALTHLHPGRRLLSGAVHPGPGGEPDAPPAPAVHPGNLDRAELFEAVHSTLEALADESPVLVVVEDVHWADKSTRELLSLLFGWPFRSPVTVIASYRSDDLHRRHPLRATAAEWVRLPAVQRLQLGPLPDPDMHRLVGSLQHRPMRESDVHAIVERAEGNAFFAEELVVAAETGDRGLPMDLADLLLVRLDRLDDEAKQVVRAAACAGRRVSHDLLARVLKGQVADLERALRTVVDANVLVRQESGYAFRHALLGEAVYDDLLPGERVRLHAAYVDALCGGDGGTAAELARHARAAHDLDTAVRASIEAGDEAMSVGGPDDAARHYETALELLARLPEADVDVVTLTVKTADAVVTSGHPQRARKLVERQLTDLGTDLPAEQRARMLVTMAAAALLTDVPQTKGAWEATQEALGLVSDAPTPLRARLLAVHARACVSQGLDEEAARMAMEALTVAQKLDLSMVVADATTTLAGIEQRAGDPGAAERSLEQIVAQATADRDADTEMRGLYLLGDLLQERGDLAGASRAYQRAVACARSAGRPWAPYAFDARVMRAIVEYQRGEWDSARAVADMSGESPPPVAESLLLAARMAVLVGRGDDEADQVYARIRPVWDRDGLLVITAGAAAVDLYGQRGELTQLLGVHDDMVAAMSALWHEFFQARIRLSALVLGHLADAAVQAPAGERAGLVARAPELMTGVEGVLRQVDKRKRPLGPEGLAWVARARAEEMRLRWLAGVEPPTQEELLGAWQEALDGFRAMGHRYEVARTQLSLGTVLRAVGDPAAAREHIDAARRTARELGAEPLLARLRVLGAVRSRDEGRRQAVLTGREAEILELVAQGRSNSEIARQLFISAKTVSVHVSNILAKLGAAGRTEAAAIARRDGLLPGVRG